MTKMVEIIEQVGGERMARRAAAGFEGPGYFKRDEKGRLVEDLDSQVRAAARSLAPLEASRALRMCLTQSQPAWIRSLALSQKSHTVTPRLARRATTPSMTAWT